MNPRTRQAVVLAPQGGRRYEMGKVNAVFKADMGETDSRYSVSEWWLEPHTQGPGTHQHDEDDIFYVIEGTAHVLVNGEWIEAPRGAFVLVPGGMPHDFENRTDARCGLLNLSIPGGFEEHMLPIVEWFRKRG